MAASNPIGAGVTADTVTLWALRADTDCPLGVLWVRGEPADETPAVRSRAEGRGTPGDQPRRPPQRVMMDAGSGIEPAGLSPMLKSAFAICLAAMTVGAPDIAFRDLFREPLQPDGTTHRRADFEVLIAPMIEL